MTSPRATSNKGSTLSAQDSVSLDVAMLSHPGMVRPHNEDAIFADSDYGLVILADGMGGYNAGEVASGIAVKTIVNLVREQVEREDLNVQDRESGLSRPTIILRDAIHRANKIIYQTARTQPHSHSSLLACSRLPMSAPYFCAGPRPREKP